MQERQIYSKVVREAANLVGKTPEEQGHNHGAPELSHDVEEAEGPVAQDGDGPGEARTHSDQQLFREGCHTRRAT